MRRLRRGPQSGAGEGTATNDCGDELLVMAAQGGNPQAFAQLYDRYQDVVLRFCFYRLGSWDEAGDAAQQTFTEAFAGLKRFRDRDDSFGPGCCGSRTTTSSISIGGERAARTSFSNRRSRSRWISLARDAGHRRRSRSAACGLRY